MNFLQVLYHILKSLREKYLIHHIYKVELQNIERKRSIYSKTVLSQDQEYEIKSYWKKISGYNISTKWHRLYQGYTGKYNKQYFPEILYTTMLEPRLSPSKFHEILSDKGLLTSIFPGDKRYRCPYTLLNNCYGTFTDENRKIIPSKIAFDKLSECGIVFIKPTVGTSSGVGVRKLVMHNGIDEKSGDRVDIIINHYSKNFIVQECIQQSHYLSSIYAESLNTFRVITFICEGKVFHAPLAMRIGRGGSYIDNIHAGGLCIGITPSNTLRKIAFTEMSERFERHPDTNIKFDGYHIPILENIISVAEGLHGYIPQIKMISWDWSIDKKEKPVLIEINISGQAVWFPQMVNGESIFGQYTEYFADMIRKK